MMPQKFESKLTTPDLPPEVGAYIKDLENQLALTLPRREELSLIPLDRISNQEIDELTRLNGEAKKLMDLIRKSRDKKRIVTENEKEDPENYYKKALDNLKEELDFSPRTRTHDI